MSELVDIIDLGGTYDVHTGIMTVDYLYVYSDGSSQKHTVTYTTHQWKEEKPNFG